MLTNVPLVELFNFLSSPRGPAEEFQTGLDAWGMGKAPNLDSFTQGRPPKVFNEPGHDHL